MHFKRRRMRGGAGLQEVFILLMRAAAMNHSSGVDLLTWPERNSSPRTQRLGPDTTAPSRLTSGVGELFPRGSQAELSAASGPGRRGMVGPSEPAWGGGGHHRGPLTQVLQNPQGSDLT